MATITSTSRKRKQPGPDTSTYYAVKAGHTPGVYLTWLDCQTNITGFKGAAFKKFDSRKDAEDFVAGKVVTNMKDGKNEKKKFYGVAVGKKPGVYEDWIEAQEQILGVKGPKYKKFDTREEAEDFVTSGGKKVEKKIVIEDEIAEVGPAMKKAKIGKKGEERGIVRVYTDGSSRGNGKVGAVAGVGVFFGVNDPRNVSEPLTGARQTNQRAELTAILRALQIVPITTPLEIITDSAYSINCSTDWYKNWIKHDWKTSTGKVVENKDIVQDIRRKIDERGEMVVTKFTWIKGHNDDPGNEAADRLAVAGAMGKR